MKIVPLWLAVLVISRDIAILFAVFLLVFEQRRIPWRALPIGKITTFSQHATIFAAISCHYFGLPLAMLYTVSLITGILTIASWWQYFQKYLQIQALGSEMPDLGKV